MKLDEAVYRYYLDNRHSLGNDKTFHFATRMAAWRGEPEAFELLRELRGFIVEPNLELVDILKRLVTTPQSGQRNAHELRQPYFDKYPSLYGIHSALFRTRHLEAVYGIDARDALFATTSQASIDELQSQLLKDPEAVRILSTFAINFLYLYNRVVLRNNDSLDLNYLYDLGDGYDTSDKLHLQLLIYLYTHCIIGESNFYTRTIDDSKLPAYRKMLARLEPLIAEHFSEINLDNKLEFLVCARICGIDTPLFARVEVECASSISPDGTFLIDTHNSNIQHDRHDFVRSEHRNVLYIMSQSAYTPHSTLV